jgi:hypothetical protein
MPIEGNGMMGPIMRKPDPQQASMTLPKAEQERINKAKAQQKPGGAVFLGSYMTREELLDYIREHQAAEKAKREYMPPPPPPTERQKKQIEEEQEAGRRRVAFYEAQKRNTAPIPADDPGKPMAVPADGAGTADQTFAKMPKKGIIQPLGK